MRCHVVITAEAERNIQDQVDWLYAQSPKGAESWLKAAHSAIETLRRNPQRNTLAPESRYRDREYRQLLFKTRRGRTYRALYYIEGDTVWVTHIRGPHQRPLTDRSDDAEMN